MTRVGLWLGGVLLIVLLSGCIQQFIPNQSVGNLYGFNNFNIDMSVSSLGGAFALIAGQAEAFRGRRHYQPHGGHLRRRCLRRTAL